MIRLQLSIVRRFVVVPLVVSKVVVFIAVGATLWFTNPNRGIPPWEALRAAFFQWDAHSYVEIATSSYPHGLDYHDAFFPGYPLALHAVNMVIPDIVASGLLLSVIAEAVALYYIARLLLLERDRTAAYFATWAVAFAPFAFFFTALYTEASFVAAAAACLYYARSREFTKAAIAAAVGCSIRITGIVLLVVVAMEYFRSTHWRVRSGIVVLAIIPLPVVAFALYLHGQTGDYLAFIHAQSLPSFNEGFALPWDGFTTTLDTALHTTSAENRFLFVRELIVGVSGFALCAVAWIHGRLPRSFAMYCTLVLLLSTATVFWRSVGRYELAMIPVVILFADFTKFAKGWRVVLVVDSAILCLWGATIFTQGMWLA